MANIVQMQPFEPPPVERPSAAQQQALHACGEPVRRALLRALGGTGAQCEAPAPAAWTERQTCDGNTAWALHTRWTQGVPWCLMLDEAAVRALLAVLLGQEELTPQPLSALDLSLLRLPLRQLAQEVGRELPGRVPLADIELTRGTPAPLLEPVVTWEATLRHGGVEGRVALIAPWAALAPLICPEPDDTRLRPEELAHAPVLVEATLVGPSLTARDLMGMQPGDVLSLGSGDRQSILSANGQPFARGRIGAKGPQLAVSIQHVEPAGLPEGSLSEEE